MGNVFMSPEDKEILNKIKAFNKEELRENEINNEKILFRNVRGHLVNILEPKFAEFGIYGHDDRTSLFFKFTDALGVEHSENITKSELLSSIKDVMKEQKKRYKISSRLASNNGSSDFYIVVNVLN